MRTVVILIDTLRKDFLKAYNPDSWALTPNLDAFSQESLVFDNHFVGSMPCMPARRDIFTGRLNFLERSWGPIEVFDVTFPQLLRQHKIFTHITTDHCHYMRLAGDGYLQQFDTWDYHRGQEGDPWISSIDDPDFMPEEYYGKLRRQYQWNRTVWGQDENLYPTPRTFQSACEWLTHNQGKDDFFLMVEVFDPHEPFDVPDDYLKLYDDQYTGPYFETPNYGQVDVPDEALEHIRKRYAALLTMTDKHFGKVIDKLKELNMFDDTLIIVTSDHGYFLGERQLFGKNYMHSYNEVAAIPLFVRDPNKLRVGQRESRVSQNIDIMPTLLDYYKIPIPNEVRGKSWFSLIHGTSASEDKDYALYGTHGVSANVTDTHYSYFRAPNTDNQPLSEYTTSLATIRSYLGKDSPESIQVDRYFDRTQYPIYKVPITEPSLLKGQSDLRRFTESSLLFDLSNDPHQTQPIQDSDLEYRYVELLKRALKEHDAPEEQFKRLGLDNCERE